MSTRALAQFLANLRYEDLPKPAVEATKDLYLDWLGSCLAGKNAKPVVALQNFAAVMGPASGPSEILVARHGSSPLFAALINAAASHVVEQDDLHNGSILHPATVVFPPALAVAQALRASGRDFITACVAGYEAGCRVGEFLGPTHYKIFHMTGTAGTLGAAAAVAHLLKLDADEMQHALGSAGTQAAGLWEFLRDAADSKQLHCAHAAAAGLLAAYLARDGFTGAKQIFEGEKAMGAGLSQAPNVAKLVDGLGERWAVVETSFKFHASCRHTHPAADALLELVTKHDLDDTKIRKVTCRVYQAAYDVLSAVVDPTTVHQSKFSMGFVLALIARYRRAGIHDFGEAALRDERLRAFVPKVSMVVDPQIAAVYPAKWEAVVEVETHDGARYSARTEVPKGDPGNRLSRKELEDKAISLGGYQRGATTLEMRRMIEAVWALDKQAIMASLLAGESQFAARARSHA